MKVTTGSEPYTGGLRFDCVCGHVFYFGKKMAYSRLIGMKMACPDCAETWQVTFRVRDSRLIAQNYA